MNIEKMEDKTKIAVKLLKAVSNERRLMILCTIYREEKSVGELEQVIGLSQSALSQHLSRLRRDGIVGTRRKAQTIYYSIKDKDARTLLRCIYRMYCLPLDDDKNIDMATSAL